MLLASLPIHIHLLAAALVVVTLFMILVILIQRPKGGGLSAAFGGGAGSGSSQSIVGGAGMGSMLNMATIISFVMFLGLAMGLIWASRAAHNPDVGPKAPQVEVKPEDAPSTKPKLAPATSDAVKTDAPVPAVAPAAPVAPVVPAPAK